MQIDENLRNCFQMGSICKWRHTKMHRCDKMYGHDTRINKEEAIFCVTYISSISSLISVASFIKLRRCNQPWAKYRENLDSYCNLIKVLIWILGIQINHPKKNWIQFQSTCSKSHRFNQKLFRFSHRIYRSKFALFWHFWWISSFSIL